MIVTKLDYPHHIKKENVPELSMALGYFDGVHLGHQKVINAAKEKAESQGIKSAVMTFDPHPSVVLGKGKGQVQFITPLKDKIRIIEEMGIDHLFVIHFTQEFSYLLPQEFIDQYIIGLNVKHVCAGFDFTYGRMGKGTMETIQFHSRDMFGFSTVDKLSSEDEKVSSTRIRKLISEGKTDELLVLLGRFYTTSGIVVHGDKRGRTIGFPTANVDLEEDYLIPPLGVYAVRIQINGQWHQGVCNIGFKPTFNHETAKKPSVEVHIFNFDDTVYGNFAVIEWHSFLRREQKFSGIDELVAQIEKDKRKALDYFR